MFRMFIDLVCQTAREFLIATYSLCVCYFKCFRVSTTPETRMGIGNLITVFGPSIVGHSTSDPEPMQTINETKYQAMVRVLAYMPVII